MHRIKTSARGRVGLLAAIAALVAIIGVMPMFGSTAYSSAGTGIKLNGVVNISEFDIPNGPITKTSGTIAIDAQPTGTPAVLIVSVADDISTLFPDAGQIVLGLTRSNPGGTELMVYNNGTKLTAQRAAGQPNLIISVTSTAAFGKSGTLLIDNEQVNFDQNAGGAGCASLIAATQFCITSKITLTHELDATVTLPGCKGPAPEQFCVTERAKVGSKTAWAAGTLIQLATQLTADGDALTATPGKTTLTADIAEDEAPPFPISVGSNASFSDSGYLTISHQEVEAFSPLGTEYFQYDKSSCGTGSQLCLIVASNCTPTSELLCRGDFLNPNETNYLHEATGFSQPGGTSGISNVNEHARITVESTAGFFPTGNLMIYNVSGGNVIEAELVGRNQATTNIKPTIPADTFHVTSRGGAAAPFDKTDAVKHQTGSIVVSAATHLTCRAKNETPVPDEPESDHNGLPQHAQSPVGSSVGIFSVCYTRSQPSDAPLSTYPLDQPIIGQDLVLLNALNQPFLSTGGFTHLLYGNVPHVDVNGTDDDNLDLVSPCIVNYTPGSNLGVLIDIDTSTTNDYTEVSSGDIAVVTDTIHTGTESPGPCDDPRGTGDITLTNYIYPGDGTPGDDDTDSDGCTDDQELDNFIGSGQRDPWNPGDFFDADDSGAITIDDIFDVAGFFGLTSGTGTYDQDILPGGGNGKVDGEERDRGPSYGPFGHNLSVANGSITIDDIFAVAVQFGHSCV